jgi:hypothetical protein
LGEVRRHRIGPEAPVPPAGLKFLRRDPKELGGETIQRAPELHAVQESTPDVVHVPLHGAPSVRPSVVDFDTERVARVLVEVKP